MIVRPSKRSPFHFTIPSGVYALVTHHGKHRPYTDPSSGIPSPVWPSGLHLAPPWLKPSHLVTRQSIPFHTKIKSVTRDDVTAMIDVTVILRVMGDDPEKTPGDDPMNVYKFVHEVTPGGLQSQLRDSLVEIMGMVVRCLDHAKVFGLRGARCEEFEELREKLFAGEVSEKSIVDAISMCLNKKFNPQGVEISKIIIKEIELPELIQRQMTEKTITMAQNAMERMQQKHDMLSLIQNSDIESLNQTHKENKLELDQNCQYQSAIQNLELELDQAKAQRQIQSIETQMIIDVELVQAESNGALQRMEDDTKLETERIREQSVADSEVLVAKARAEADIILARGELDVAKIASKGDRG